MAHDNPRSDDVHATVSRRLRAAAMRYSRSRRAVVDVLAGAGRPLTLPEILVAGTGYGLAQSSAYRNLGELVDVGVVRRLISGDDHGRFELHESLTGHHHHLVCMVCGRVEDFEAPEEFEAGINMLVETAAQRGFVVDGHLFDMVGRCATCS
ncbi:MAG: transcriptional repressor [Acidimicrobiales bacterium]|jgi:Fur family ferric uptake transcriptional regulator|nr:transcriptional repressor [Acidimicrobiales bacterium]